MPREYKPMTGFSLHRSNTVPVDMSHCRAWVSGDNPGQCRFKPITEPDANGRRWCKRHSPDYEAEKEAESRAKWAARTAAWKQANDRKAAERAALALLPDVLAYLKRIDTAEGPHDPERLALDQRIRDILSHVEPADAPAP